MDDDEGLYNHYEWEGQPGYERETGDYDSDGFEIADIYVVDQSEKPTWINESESPEENDIIEELKELVSLKKESISTDEIKELFIVLKTKKIAVIGDFCLDTYWFIDHSCQSISLETGLSINNVKKIIPLEMLVMWSIILNL